MTVVTVMVAMPAWMSVVYAEVIVHPVQTAAAYQMVQEIVVMVSVVPVMMKLMKAHVTVMIMY